jgi:periplasmic divalent cation tolerance protein
MDDVTISWITCAHREEAEMIAETLVKEKIVACVNIIPGITSIFFWEEKVCREEEFLLMVKSVSTNQNALLEKVKTLHSYSTPEVISVPVQSGNPDYLRWVMDVVK